MTSWPPKFPGMGMGVERLAERIADASNGRLKIKVYGGGELVPPLEFSLIAAILLVKYDPVFNSAAFGTQVLLTTTPCG